MDVIVIDSEAFDALKIEFKTYVKQAVAEALAEKKAAEDSDWISIEVAQILLPFKSKTSWQKLRDTSTIKFTQFGRKIMYSRKSILEYLNSNKIKF
ncbi:MAG: DNA-binding protein [Bacteroidetes bacterium]|nr:DNA-binding protein [Bacteroidota bacterium]HET6243521.1 DNA-binding protein [Bacteroidia bacterium]